MVSAKAVLVLVLAMAFILSGGVGLVAGAADRLRFEASSLKQSINPRGED